MLDEIDISDLKDLDEVELTYSEVITTFPYVPSEDSRPTEVSDD